jgi:hypothetical protein
MIIAKILRILKKWLLVVKSIKHSHKWWIAACSCKLDGYIIQDFF